MLAIRISAYIALLFVLLAVAAFLMPLFYKQPLHAHVGANDVVKVIAYGSLLVGALLALMRSYSTILTAAWSWSVAFQTTLLGRSIAHPTDYSALLAKFSDRGGMRGMLEHANRVQLQIGMFYLAISFIALALAIVGDMSMRSARRHSA